MGNPRTQIEEESPTEVQVTLLGPEQTQEEEEEEEEKDTQLDPILRRLDIFLCFFGFHQSSLLGFLLSWAAFLLLGVSIPVVILRVSSCYDCEKHQIYNFELDIIVSRSCLAAVSLGCVSHNLRKYGIRKFLFVDRLHGQMLRFRKEYTEKIQGFFRLLFFWIFPCFLLKTACEVIRIAYAYHDFWWQSVAMLLASVISWIYLITISLTACLLFNLVCNLQVIHLENYGKLLERDSDVSVFIEEHLRLRLHLSKISHRFRIFLLLAFLVVTASQFVTLFRAMASRRIINFINECDFAVFSIVQVVGIILCLNAAVKISHRAQGVVSVVCRWHALLTCNSTDASELRVSNSAGSLEAMNPSGSLPMNYSESDLESLDYLAHPINTQPVSYMSTYHKRQAFVTYLQSNPGGITIFGWTVDRALINTIFFLEFTLVLFVLGNTLGLTAN
ncbi:uncharacterized protein LOC122080077 [Macadamia integrifolia]|uniref:uncharacterized protein LOC122080077 n=1 Tax=Macadamia integrifolia TaxID=60698 RepID=UPI001C4FF253|nr:uncharacterized protein LOC122080077 [Macadamia integrifolia]